MAVPAPTGQTIEANPPPPGEPVGDEFRPWKDIIVALEGWEYAIWEEWFAEGDLTEQDKRARLLLSVLRRYDPSASLNLTESRSMRHPGINDVFRFRFSLYGEPDKITDAILGIHSQLIALADNYKTYAGKAYAVLEYADGDRKMIRADITKNADLDDAFERVMEVTYATLGAKYEQDSLTRESRFFPWIKDALDQIEEALADPPDRESLEAMEELQQEVFEELEDLRKDIMADEFATDEELAAGKYSEFKDLMERADKIWKSDAWKRAWKKFGIDIPSWAERYGKCPKCGKKFNPTIEQSVIDEHLMLHRYEDAKSEEDIERDSWLDPARQHEPSVNLRRSDGGLINDLTKPWAVSPSYTVSHLEWRYPLYTSDGKATQVDYGPTKIKMPVNTITPNHYGVPLITPITPQPGNSPAEQGHFSRTPSPQQAMPDIEYASIQWCDTHFKPYGQHKTAELDLDIQKLKASYKVEKRGFHEEIIGGRKVYICNRCGNTFAELEDAREHVYDVHVPYIVDEIISEGDEDIYGKPQAEEAGIPFLSEEDEDIYKIYSFRDYQVGKFIEAFKACGNDEKCKAEVRNQWRSVESGRLWNFLDKLHSFYYALDTDEQNRFKEQFPNLVEIMDEWAIIEELKTSKEEDTPQMEPYDIPAPKPAKTQKPKGMAPRYQAYHLTPAEVDAITKHAWETGCTQCFSVLEMMNVGPNGDYSIDVETLNSFPEAKKHFTKIVGSGEVRAPKTPAFDPESPEFEKIKEFVEKRRAAGKPTSQFGRFTGLPKDVPTLNEWGISEYLRSLGVKHELHYPVGKIFPEYAGKPTQMEFDIWIPDLAIAIEVNPPWHKGGRAELGRVAQIDELKEKIAKEHGIDLITVDPGKTFVEFASQIDDKIAPELRAHGVKAPNLLAESESKESTETKAEQSSRRQDTEKAFAIIDILKNVDPNKIDFTSPEGRLIVEGLTFLHDSDTIALFQPPNVDEAVFERWKPYIDLTDLIEPRWMASEPQIKEFRRQLTEEVGLTFTPEEFDMISRSLTEEAQIAPLRVVEEPDGFEILEDFEDEHGYSTKVIVDVSKDGVVTADGQTKEDLELLLKEAFRELEERVKQLDPEEDPEDVVRWLIEGDTYTGVLPMHDVSGDTKISDWVETIREIEAKIDIIDRYEKVSIEELRKLAGGKEVKGGPPLFPLQEEAEEQIPLMPAKPYNHYGPKPELPKTTNEARGQRND